jgi:hypothetical protein
LLFTHWVQASAVSFAPQNRMNTGVGPIIRRFRPTSKRKCGISFVLGHTRSLPPAHACSRNRARRIARKPTGPATQFPPLASDAGPEATILFQLSKASPFGKRGIRRSIRRRMASSLGFARRVPSWHERGNYPPGDISRDGFQRSRRYTYNLSDTKCRTRHPA